MSVENIVKFVTGRKMLVKESKKVACNVGFDIFTVWWVKPNYMALSVPSCVMYCSKRVAVRNASGNQSCFVLGRDCTKVRRGKKLLCWMIMS